MTKDSFKILVTDDDPDLRDLLTEALKNWGYTAGVASEGNEALKALKAERYHIVISDLMMPGMDGLELLYRIKDLDKEILVIIITGYATIETAVKAIEAGAYDYITKPFRLDELMVVIKNACERLRLTTQNKTLLDELRHAHREIATLKGGRGPDEPDIRATGTDSSQAERFAANESPNPLKQHEYIKEVDRLIRIKSAVKP
ncbi:MAG: response regulator [Deltaproteobacteria bacterium]